MMTIITIIMSLMVSTVGFAEETKAAQDTSLALMEAKVYLSSGELEKARHMVEEVLAIQENDTEAQFVLSQIIDREIAQEKEPSQNPKAEDLTAKERQIEVDRWLERAQSYAANRQYEQAILSAERVFLYQPENLKASRFIDSIQGKALEEQTHGANSLNQSAKEEAQERVTAYSSQAKQWLNQKRYGSARLALDKILLLDPTNEEARQLKKQMRNLLENEKGKTL